MIPTTTLESIPEEPNHVFEGKAPRNLVLGLLILAGLALAPLVIQKISLTLYPVPQTPNPDPARSILLAQSLETDIQRMDKKLATRVPRSHFLIINTSANEFYLYKGQQLIRKDKCSTGSYVLLKNGEQQEWMFKTPKGEFEIKGKTTSPVWKKPDWAFVEEGLPVPSPNHSSRFEYGVLGDYALSLGQGYLIHGTLYQRFLGLPVTHGCVRLNDENLELVYRALQHGSKVYIY